MPIEFNSAALDLFRTASFDNANTIANLGEKKIVSGGTWAPSIKILGRTELERTANNQVREELLRCLGKAFNIDGITENDDGTVEFTRGFMDRLSALLGRDLKAGDFGIPDAGGRVKSGKPLTQRRITAILNRAEKVVKDSAASVENPFDIPLPSYMRNSVKNPFYRDYAAKLQIMKKDFGVAGLSDMELQMKAFGDRGLVMLAKASACLNFLMNQLDVLKKKEVGPDESCLRDSPAWEFEQEIEEDHSNFKEAKFEYRDPETNEFVPLEGTAGYAMFIGKQIAGGFIHLERADFREKTSDSVKPLRNYIVDTLKLFVMKTIDLYFESKEKGMDKEYLAFLAEDPGACMEDKGLKLVDWEKDVLYSAKSMSAEEKRKAAEMERIADLAPAKGEPPKGAEKLIYSELERLNDLDAKYANSENWSDFADEVKKALVGKTVTIVEPDGEGPGHHKFHTLKDKNGEDVVRPLTEADIDRLGPICLANLSEV